jgi:hypothetical protein
MAHLQSFLFFNPCYSLLGRVGDDEDDDDDDDDDEDD